MEEKEKIIVGVNQFSSTEKETIPILRIDDSIRKIQIQKLARLKEQRSPITVDNCLAKIAEAARSGENLMPHVIAAVEGHCTLGEIADSLRKLFGEFR